MNRNSLFILAALAVAGVGAYAYFGQSRTTDAGTGAPIVNVVVPVLTSAEKEGEAAYDQYCAKCHGSNAAGQQGVAPPFVHPIYRPGHHADAAFYMAAMNGARAHHWTFGDMPPVEGVAKQDIDSIVLYVRAMQRANGIQ